MDFFCWLLAFWVLGGGAAAAGLRGVAGGLEVLEVAVGLEVLEGRGSEVLGVVGVLEVLEVAGGVGQGGGIRGVRPGGLVHRGGGSLGRGKGLSGGWSGAAA